MVLLLLLLRFLVLLANFLGIRFSSKFIFIAALGCLLVLLTNLLGVRLSSTFRLVSHSITSVVGYCVQVGMIQSAFFLFCVVS